MRSRVGGTASAVAGVVVMACTLACLVPTPTDGGDVAAEGEAGATTCVAGTTLACTCTDGRAGAQSCNAAGNGYGACTCTGGGCAVQPGGACTTTDQCCPVGGVPAVCASLPGAGQICSARCNVNTDCSTGCCAQLADGSRACTVARWCAPAGACTSAVGQACSSDAVCCPDPGNGSPSACATGSSGFATCGTLCVNNGGCASSCCVARSDGLKTCRPPGDC